jgi:hypothetical protein
MKSHFLSIFLGAKFWAFEMWRLSPAQHSGHKECWRKHRNLDSGSLKVKKKMWILSPRYECPTSYYKLNFPATIFHGRVFKI